MNFVRITKDNISELEEIKGLYFASFPEDERRPWESIVDMVNNGFSYFNMIIARDCETGKMLGFYTIWRFPQAFYVEHFAVSFECRNRGIGSSILRNIKEFSGNSPVVVEVELPDKGTDAVKRIDFYKRNGFEALEEFPYYQPPYRPDLEEVPLMLMVSMPIEDLNTFVIMLHTLVYNQ